MCMHKKSILIKEGFFLVVLFLIFGQTGKYVFAAEKQQQQAEVILEKKEESQKKELSQVEKILTKHTKETDSSKIVLADKNDESALGMEHYDYDHAYCVRVLNHFMVTDYNKEKSVKKITSEQKGWLVPYTSSNQIEGIVELYQEDDGKYDWYCQSESDVGEKGKVYPPNKKELADFIGGQISEDERIESIEYLHNALYYLTLIYITTDKMEYFIPYAEEPEVLQSEDKSVRIENARLYTVDAFFDTMDRIFDESILKNAGSEGGGLPYRSSESRYQVVGKVAGAIAIIIMLAVVFRWKKRRRLLLGSVTLCSIIFLIGCANVEKENKTQDGSEKQRDTSIVQEQKAINKLEKPRIIQKVNKRTGIVTVTWNEMNNVQKYRVKIYHRDQKTSLWVKTEEKVYDPKDDKRLDYTTIYGNKYRCVVSAYAKDKSGQWKKRSTTDYFIVRLPRISWMDQEMYPKKKEKKKQIDLKVTEEEEKRIHYVSPSGIEIYRGRDAKKLSRFKMISYSKLKREEKNDKEYSVTYKTYTDKNVKKGINYCYKLRAYTVYQGKKYYGKCTVARLLSTDNSQGKSEVTLQAASSKKIKSFQLMLKNKNKENVYIGKKYASADAYTISDYQSLFRVEFYNGDQGFYRRSNNYRKAFVLEYRYDQKENWKKLSGKDSLTLRPDRNVFLRFRQADHKIFANPFLEKGFQSINAVFSILRYKGKNAYVSFDLPSKWKGKDSATKAYIQWSFEEVLDCG